MHKKFLAVFIAITLVSVLFTGCASTSKDASSSTAKSSESTSASSAPSSGEKIPLTFYSVDNDSMKEYISGFISRFIEAYPNIDLKAQVISGSTKDFETQMSTSILSGMTPDVTYETLSTFTTYATTGYFMDISDYINNWEDKNDILDGTLAISQIAGKYYCLGAVPAPILFTYRTDLFEEAGLDPNSPPTNWKELEDYAVKLTKKDASGNIIQSGFEFPFQDDTLQINAATIRQNGADYVDEATDTPTFTEPGVIEAMEWLAHLYSQGISVPSSWNNRANGPFYAGKAAMAYMQVVDVTNIIKAQPQLEGKIKFASPISNKQPAAFCGYRMMSIWKDSKHADAAWELLKFYMSPEEMQTRFDKYDFAPVRKSLAEKYIAVNPEVNSKVIETINVGRGVPNISFNNATFTYFSAAHEAIMSGADAAKTLEEAQKQLLIELGRK